MGRSAAPLRDRSDRSGPSGIAVGAAVLGLVAVAAFGAVLRLTHPGPLPVDEWWHGVASVSPGSPASAIAVFLAQLGGGAGAAACAGIAAALCCALRRPRDAAAIATAALLGVLLSELGKSLVLRPRPWDQLYESHGTSYPSGHSMGAAALAVSAALVALGSERLGRRAERAVALAALGWMLLMMWSRTALHVHWLSDTVAGAILGASAAVLARRLWFGGGRAAAPRGRTARAAPR
ncbi:phosphatase PAP2 family protein [Leucobacter allii]|uniref:Phosphatase PAP2 family protein n=1 Tax=Leucobacter allii TaxID=2932247 RepID=A0ABY4FNZ5_9MICO|nr:phosphatase PAP2 family protein [Leucobacter allii]UOQ57939.1 phosphatase PAP2 family protein [Leucobacter allii]